MKKTFLTTLAVGAAMASLLAPVDSAFAQYYDGHRPPPPPYRDHGHDHHHGNGGAIAGGLAAGVVGGIIGGAIANSGPRYAPPPPPPPRCWLEKTRVQNAYNGGSHWETVRVCR